ncbi:extracellular solute-binding protein [Pannonibacter phragmitetus]|uniref:extracellular solute-binding protein n=1 Tax=Pannonibacter phragmitetus TaxID=121719 RepID=UPI00067CFB61|nr:extracellular solute-binding protein [Pannonibacter phragmitetus]
MTLARKASFRALMTAAVMTMACWQMSGGQARAAEEPQWRHATALTGEPRYGADATHFNYVNPDAPKGGTVKLSSIGGFDNFNVLAPRGNLAPGLGLIYESLMESSLDEYDISSMYGVIAEAMRYPDDYSWVEYRLNPKARWQDGTPITAQDVIWSFEKAIELSSQQKFYYKDVSKVEELPGGVIRFSFASAGNRELPHTVGQILVLPKHWWEGTDARGNKRDISRTTLEPPLASGPYRMKSFVANREVVYERVQDYWGEDLPIRAGTNNFDEVRYVSFLDRTVAFEAFKGGQYDFHLENSASAWLKNYDFPAARDGRVVKEEFIDHGSGRMQAFVPNLRLKKFQDPRVRLALNYAYDFETSNTIISGGLNKRINSYFAGTDELEAKGLPEGKELEILETVRDEVPPEVFTTPYVNPVGGSSEKARANLREAVKLLREAGYSLQNGRMVDAQGTPLSFEMLYFDQGAERTLLPYQQNLRDIGITMTLRVVDMPQYINRVNSRDFEMTTLVWGQSLSPGNEQRNMWGSESADRENSQNYAGIRNPAVDKLIDRVIFAKDREELVAATRALDRVLLWNHYVIPQFYADVDRTARWNRFGHPDNMPEFTYGFPTIWWYDASLAAKTGGAR